MAPKTANAMGEGQAARETAKPHAQRAAARFSRGVYFRLRRGRMIASADRSSQAAAIAFAKNRAQLSTALSGFLHTPLSGCSSL